MKRLRDVVDEYDDYTLSTNEEHQVLPDVALPHSVTQPFEAMRMNPKLLQAMGRQMTVGGPPGPTSPSHYLQQPSPKSSPARKGSARDIKSSRREATRKHGAFPSPGPIPEHSVMSSTFQSRLPEKSHEEELSHQQLTTPPLGKFVSRVFDGDLCMTRDEAYQKFRERQVREAMAMQGGQFFGSRQKKIGRVVDGGGVVNLIMRQPSAVNTNRSRHSDQASNQESQQALISNTHAMFNNA